MRAELTRPAREDFLEAVSHYGDRAVGLGERFVLDFERSVELIERFPTLGAPGPAETRRIRLYRFQYGVVYRIEGEAIRIYAVAAEKKRPGYGRDRL